jgi:hypothetical protein
MVPEKISRVYYGEGTDDVMEMPNLIDIQLASCERFLQRSAWPAAKPIARQGLEDVFSPCFPSKAQTRTWSWNTAAHLIRPPPPPTRPLGVQCKQKA